MALDHKQIEMLSRHYEEEVEEKVKEVGLQQYLGTDLLNPIQNEVNDFHAKMEEAFATSKSQTFLKGELQRSLARVGSLLQQVQAEKFGQKTSNLGAISERMSMIDSPAWSAVVSEVALKIETIGQQYGKVIVNQPDKEEFDKAMASALSQLEKGFAVNPSPSNAQTSLQHAMVQLDRVEQTLRQRKSTGLQNSLSNLISQKEVELLNTISVLKLHSKDMSKAEVEVITAHEAKALELLAKMKGDPANYDKLILQQNLRTFDAILAPLVQMRDSVQYRSALSGGNFSSPRRPSTKTYGFGSIPQRRYHEHQRSNPTNRSPFRDAPNVNGVRGLGSAIIDSAATQMEKVPTDTDPAIIDGVTVDTLTTNLEIGMAQGYITPADEAILRDQLSSMNITAYGGDQQLYDNSKIAIRNTIDHLRQNYINKVKAGEIAGRLPPEEGSDSQYPEGYAPVKGFLSRLGATLGISTAAILLVSVGIGYHIATKPEKTAE